MKSFAVQVEEINQEINIRLENLKDATEKFKSERPRLLESFLNEGFRADIAEQKADAELTKIKHKIESIGKELDKMLIILKNIDPIKIKAEKDKIVGAGRRQPKETIGDRKHTTGVLIVDDATIMRELIRNTLAANKIPVLGEAENGKLALEKYKEILPELVIMDIDMPEMDGFEALAEIKAFDPEAKVVMCSQVSKQSTVDDAIKLGAINFIVKPIKADILVGTVNKILGKK